MYKYTYSYVRGLRKTIKSQPEMKTKPQIIDAINASFITRAATDEKRRQRAFQRYAIHILAIFPAKNFRDGFLVVQS